MAENISEKGLIKCLVEKDKYKGTAVYLHEVLQFNEKVYPMFNEAITRILLKDHTNCMAKLLALRLFK